METENDNIGMKNLYIRLQTFPPQNDFLPWVFKQNEPSSIIDFNLDAKFK